MRIICILFPSVIIIMIQLFLTYFSDIAKRFTKKTIKIIDNFVIANGNKIELYNPITNEKTIKLTDEEKHHNFLPFEFTSLVISPDSKYLATVNNYQKIRIRNNNTKDIIFDKTYREDIKHIHFSPNSQYLSMCYREKSYISVYKLDSLDKILLKTNILEKQYYSMNFCFSPDSRYIAIATDKLNNRLDGYAGHLTTIIYDMQNIDKPKMIDTEDSGYVTSIIYSPNGQQIAVGGHGSYPIIMDPINHKIIYQFMNYVWISNILYSHDNKYMIVFYQHEIKVFNTKNWKIVTHIKDLDNHVMLLNNSYKLDNGTQLIMTYDRFRIYIWNIMTGSLVKSYNDISNYIPHSCFALEQVMTN